MSEGPTLSSLFRRRAEAAQEKTDTPKDTSIAVPPRQVQDGALKANELLALTGSPELSEDEDVVDRLVRQMDVEALKFLTLVGNEDRDGEGKLIVDLKTRLEVFKMVREWLSSRRHAAEPEQPKGAAAGFEAYKTDPHTYPKGPDGKYLPRTERDPSAPRPEKKKPGRKPSPDISSAVKKVGITANDADTLMARMREMGVAPKQGN